MEDTPDSLSVSYGQYTINEMSEAPGVDVIQAVFDGNTLVAGDEHGLYVLAGTHTGWIEVTAGLVEAEPAELPAGFGAVVDISYDSPTGNVIICDWDGRRHARGQNLAHAGPGWYRIRVAAAGRERLRDQRPGGRERHSITVWPTDGPAAERVHRMDAWYERPPG